MRRASVLFVVSLPALLGACGSNAKPRTDAAVGVDERADETTGGEVPTEIDSGPQVIGACLGVCLETFFAECPRVNMACVTEAVTNDATHWMETTCYANGVKRQQSLDSTIQTITVRKT